MRYIVQWLGSYKRTIIGVILAGIAGFILYALCAYTYSDATSFFYATSRQPQAWHHAVMSYTAGLLIFLWGGASFFLVLLLLFVAYLLIMHKDIRCHWERIVAGGCLMSVLAACMAYYRCDLYVSSCAGGYVGLRLIGIIKKLADDFVITLCLFTTLFALTLLFLRFSYITVVHYVVNAGAFLLSRRFLLPVYQSIATTVWIISRPAVWLCQAIYAVCNPETVHNAEQSILEFEQDLKQTKLQDDQFWQEYKPSIGYAASSVVQKDDEPDLDESWQDDCYMTEEPQESIAHEKPTAYVQMQEAVESRVYVEPTETYILPKADIFIGNHEERDDPEVMHYLQERAQLLEQKLQRFGVSGKIVAIKRGPVVTLFEYEPEIDSKISKITALEDDLALALQALSIRIIAPIPGKPFVGFEVSNKKRKDVLLADMIHSSMFSSYKGHLPLALGQDTIGNHVMVDLARMPHLLIAGSTGSGKSVALNTMLVSLLCKLRPDELRLILIDPKRLEFASYADIAHLLFPIVTNPKRAAPVLKWVVQQMEQRYELMAEQGARSLEDYNQLMKKSGNDALPLIVVIIDELADLMMTAGREIEDLIARITQMARAAGIHLIVATQRPSVDVITGLIKVNFPSRISFRVTSKIDSRTILDCGGADKLLGRGDMLFLDSQDATLKRLHGAYVSDHEITQVVEHIKRQQPVAYLSFDDELQQSSDNERDEIYEDVLEYLEEIDEISISLLQRKFRIGYNRSARIIDMLEAEGLITASGNGKTRSVIRS